MITGIKTTIPFQQAIMHDPDFVRGHYNTSFVTKLIEARGEEFGSSDRGPRREGCLPGIDDRLTTRVPWRHLTPARSPRWCAPFDENDFFEFSLTCAAIPGWRRACWPAPSSEH